MIYVSKNDKLLKLTFDIQELRNRQTHSEVIENDRAVLISLAKLLNIKKICYEQLKNESDNRNVEDKKCNFNNFLSKGKFFSCIKIFNEMFYLCILKKYDLKL